jgi:hypothetical protein
MDTKELTPEERKNIEGLNYLTWDMFDSPGEPGADITLWKGNQF